MVEHAGHVVDSLDHQYAPAQRFVIQPDHFVEPSCRSCRSSCNTLSSFSIAPSPHSTSHGGSTQLLRRDRKRTLCRQRGIRYVRAHQLRAEISTDLPRSAPKYTESHHERQTRDIVPLHGMIKVFCGREGLGFWKSGIGVRYGWR
jgi:hypothetical protein